MGLFCINTKGTIEGDIKSAICNLELFLSDKCDKRSEYLLTTFALKQIEDAIQKLK
jgi:hypothetical protein